MTLQEAIKSGRPFRQKGTEDWIVVRDGALRFADPRHGFVDPLSFCLVVKLCADDWEIQEPTVTITRSQYWEAVRVTTGSGEKYIGELQEGVWGIDLMGLARRLGLEGDDK